MLYRCTNISYDTDGERIANLPTTLDIEYDGNDPQNELADLISDQTGWCVNAGFSYEILPPASGTAAPPPADPNATFDIIHKLKTETWPASPAVTEQVTGQAAVDEILPLYERDFPIYDFAVRPTAVSAGESGPGA